MINLKALSLFSLLTIVSPLVAMEGRKRRRSMDEEPHYSIQRLKIPMITIAMNNGEILEIPEHIARISPAMSNLIDSAKDSQKQTMEIQESTCTIEIPIDKTVLERILDALKYVHAGNGSLFTLMDNSEVTVRTWLTKLRPCFVNTPECQNPVDLNALKDAVSDHWLNMPLFTAILNTIDDSELSLESFFEKLKLYEGGNKLTTIDEYLQSKNQNRNLVNLQQEICSCIPLDQSHQAYSTIETNPMGGSQYLARVKNGQIHIMHELDKTKVIWTVPSNMEYNCSSMSENPNTIIVDNELKKIAFPYENDLLIVNPKNGTIINRYKNITSKNSYLSFIDHNCFNLDWILCLVCEQQYNNSLQYSFKLINTTTVQAISFPYNSADIAAFSSNQRYLCLKFQMPVSWLYLIVDTKTFLYTSIESPDECWFRWSPDDEYLALYNHNTDGTALYDLSIFQAADYLANNITSDETELLERIAQAKVQIDHAKKIGEDAEQYLHKITVIERAIYDTMGKGNDAACNRIQATLINYLML